MNFQKTANSLRRKYDQKITRTLENMKSKYQDQQSVKKILKKKNPVIYKVYSRALNKDELIALTVMNSGTISNEYFMTKGHKHKKPFGEIYILIKGKGKLIIQKNRTKIIDLKRGKKFSIPKGTGHRLINAGKKRLEGITIYNKKAGYDYKLKFKKRVFKNGFKEKKH